MLQSNTYIFFSLSVNEIGILIRLGTRGTLSARLPVDLTLLISFSLSALPPITVQCVRGPNSHLCTQRSQLKRQLPLVIRTFHKIPLFRNCDDPKSLPRKNISFFHLTCFTLTD